MISRTPFLWINAYVWYIKVLVVLLTKRSSIYSILTHFITIHWLSMSSIRTYKPDFMLYVFNDSCGKSQPVPLVSHFPDFPELPQIWDSHHRLPKDKCTSSHIMTFQVSVTSIDYTVYDVLDPKNIHLRQCALYLWSKVAYVIWRRSASFLSSSSTVSAVYKIMQMFKIMMTGSNFSSVKPETLLTSFQCFLDGSWSEVTPSSSGLYTVS